MLIETGKPYPDDRYRNHEGAVIVTNQVLFDLLIIIPGISPKEEKAFRSGSLRYGMYVAETVPFLLLDFSGAKMTLDAPFNVLKVDERLQARWISDKKANAVTITAIEQQTYTVKSQRLIGLEPTFVNAFKEAAATCALHHVSPRGIDNSIQKALQQFTTEQMIARTKMYQL